MSAAPPVFADVAEAKKAMIEVMETLLTDENQELIAKALASVTPDMEEATKKQKLMQLGMPIIQNALGGVLVKYKFPPGPMGVMQGFMQFSAISMKPGGQPIAEALGMMKAGAMSGAIPKKEEIEGALANLKA